MTAPIDDAADEADTEADATVSETALRLLRRDIVSGALKPDSKLKLRVLKERYGIGGSPMREALAQLTAQGLVRQLSQKGFRVPPLSATHLLDITRSRQLVEGEAVKLAIAHGNAAWEDEIITSFHVLEHMFLRIRASKLPDVDEFEARHHRFHRALIAACPLRAITDFCEQLYMQATRYRVLLRRYAFTPESLVAEHRILMRVVLDRRKSKAAEALRAHIGITADVLRGEFTDWPAGAAVKQDAAVAGAVVRAGAKTVVKHRRRTK